MGEKSYHTQFTKVERTTYSYGQNMMSILLVDDNSDMCEIVSDCLEEEGYNVVSVPDGESALSRLKCNHYDLVIVDYRLHGIDGLQVLEKAHQIDSSLITVMISAFGSDSMRSRSKALGVHDFIEKPFDIEKMVTVVKNALNRKK